MLVDKKWWIALLVGLLSAGSGMAEKNTPARAEAALTYNAHLYLQAEQRIEDWLSHGNFKLLEQQLAEDFFARSPAAPDFDKPFWLKDQAKRAQQGWVIRGIEVQVLGDTRIVSFRRVNPTTSRQQFIVDVWSESQNRLLSRYESLSWLPAKGQREPSSPNGRSPGGAIRPDGKG
jgi:hypothetical protein